MPAIDELLDELVVVAPEELIAHLETECARMVPVVAAALEWASRSEGQLREKAERRLRRELTTFAAHRMVS